MKSARNHKLAIACGVSVAAAGLGIISLLALQPAVATPQFATDTGKPCGYCHVGTPGGALTPAGDAFKANGNKLPK